MTSARKPRGYGFQDLTGRVFGKLSVVELADCNGQKSQRRWMCQCECGEICVILAHSLLRGATRSCGCLMATKNRLRNLTHGYASHGRPSPEYAIWMGIRRRCLRPKDRAFHHYGGRGIKIHPPWMSSFEAFIADVGPRPSMRHSLDRIDNDGNYEPTNVRWATKADQARNTRRTKNVSCTEGLIPLSALARRTGLTVQTIARGLRDGMSGDELLRTPGEFYLNVDIVCDIFLGISLSAPNMAKRLSDSELEGIISGAASMLQQVKACIGSRTSHGAA